MMIFNGEGEWIRMLDKNFITSDERRGERLRRHRIQGKENLIIDDKLESGYLGIYDYIGGCLYLEPEFLEGLLVAGIEIARSGEKEVKVKRVFCEFGNDALVPLMLKQLGHFGKFYGYDIAFMDLMENRKPSIMDH